MARYIDADKQIERYSKKLGFYIDEEGEDRFSAKCEEIRAAISALYNAPTADVEEVVHGEWIDNHCSICGMTPLGEELWEHLDLEPPKFEYCMNYCPDCGAKMDGKKVE